MGFFCRPSLRSAPFADSYSIIQFECSLNAFVILWLYTSMVGWFNCFSTFVDICINAGVAIFFFNRKNLSKYQSWSSGGLKNNFPLKFIWRRGRAMYSSEKDIFIVWIAANFTYVTIYPAFPSSFGSFKPFWQERLLTEMSFHFNVCLFISRVSIMGTIIQWC